jgi:polyadenylate-binding protein 2
MLYVSANHKAVSLNLQRYAEAAANREEADSRSIHVGGVDYACTPEELQVAFQSCGTVNRVTILTDKYENPKGFAYVEFLEVGLCTSSIQLSRSSRAPGSSNH